LQSKDHFLSLHLVELFNAGLPTGEVSSGFTLGPTMSLTISNGLLFLLNFLDLRCRGQLGFASKKACVYRWVDGILGKVYISTEQREVLVALHFNRNL
jgi:hypothetical protein